MEQYTHADVKSMLYKSLVILDCPLDDPKTDDLVNQIIREYKPSVEQSSPSPAKAEQEGGQYDLSKDPVNAIRTAILKHCSREDMVCLRDWLGTYNLPGKEQEGLPNWSNKANYSGDSYIGGYHWFHTLMGKVRDIGIYMQQHEVDSILRSTWGQQIRDIYADMSEWFAYINERESGKQMYREQEGLRWVNAKVPPELLNGKSPSRWVKIEVKRPDGTIKMVKGVAYYFPERFKTVEWEDWDDYNQEDFPWTIEDKEGGVVWLRAGWYADIDCQKCDGHWSAPLNVVEYLSESTPPVKEAGQPEGESAVWVKASERLPNKTGVYFIIDKKYERRKVAHYTKGKTNGRNSLFLTRPHDVEWLDESGLAPSRERSDDFDAAMEEELYKLPYTRHVDDGQYNDGQLAGFELGAEWAKKYLQSANNK